MNEQDRHPPRVATTLLRRFCDPRWLEEIEGDLQEQFVAQVDQDGVLKARLVYWRDVLLLSAKPYLRNHPEPTYEQARGPFMLINYFKIALRTFKKHKGYSFINVTGLAVGIACCLLIFLYVQDELSYDRWHEHSDRIYRLVANIEEGASEQGIAQVPGSLLAPLRENSSSVEVATGLLWPGTSHTFYYDDKRFGEDSYYYADSSFFDVFTFSFIHGTPQRALAEPSSMVLTHSTAARYFGDQNPIGKVIERGRGQGEGDPYTVTGVIEDIPAQSHFHFDFVLSVPSQVAPRVANVPQYIYLLLREGTPPSALQEQLPRITPQALGPDGAGQPYLSLQRLTDIHLYSNRLAELEPNGDIRYVYIFATIALLILLIACINFINITTARATKRAREIGIRKALGAHRAQLVRQFIGESVLVTLVAFPLALCLIQPAAPVLNALFGKTLRLAMAGNGAFWLACLGILTLVGFVAGSYPAFYLSAFNPVNIFKGTDSTRGSRGKLRKGLVAFQFALSTALIIGAFTTHSQMNFIQEKNLGFNENQLIVLPDGTSLISEERYNAFRDRIMQQTSVLDVARADLIPGGNLMLNPVRAEGIATPVDAVSMTLTTNFAATFGLKILEGRAFSDAFGTDATKSLLVNEALVRETGWKNPIGKTVVIPRTQTAGSLQRPTDADTLTVVGVVNDFHLFSLHRAIPPMVFTLPRAYHEAPRMFVKVRPRQARAALTTIAQTWTIMVPDRHFEFAFIDQRIDQLYNAEQNLKRLVSWFSIIGIIVACLGLFSLAAFTVEQRTKEIGIRKVFGATVADVVLLISKDFTWLVLIAVVLATPIAYITTNRWLDDFAYRVDLGAGTFAVAGLLALGIALLTVGYQAIKAALTDPVKSLRYE